MKLYKNLTKNHIKVNLFGVGVVEVPANAQAVELEETVAQAINDMTYPNVILEETVAKPKPKIVEKVEEVEEEVKPKPAPKPKTPPTKK